MKSFEFIAEQARNLPIGPTSQSIGEVTVPAEHYQVDLELLDRYQKFSSELLRLALAGIAVIGFLITNIIGDKGVAGAGAPLTWFKICAFVSAALLCLSAAASLCHRYLATDGVYYHVKAIRLRLLAKHTNAGTQTGKEKLDEAVRNRKAIYQFSGRFLFAAATLLWAGVVILATAFACALLLIKVGS